MGVTLELARFVVETPYAQLPPEVVQRTKQYVLDGLGVSLGAADHPAVDALLAFAQEMGGNPQATVIGRGTRLNAAYAALANGYLAHLLDYDDSYMPPETILHGTAPVLPVVLALGEWKGLSGREAIAAFALGFEVAARISLGLGRGVQEGGWHVTATMGTLGAAVAAAKMLGLDARRTAYSLGIAGTSASGIGEMLGTMCKAYHPGKAAMHGVMAGLLVEKGLDSSEQVLEAPRGVGWAFARKRELDSLAQGLGERWEMLAGGFKPYSCGVVAHPTIDGVIELRNRYGLKAEDVESIHARTNPYVMFAMGKMSPRTGLEGKFSTVHCAAVALIDGAARVAQYTDARVNDPEVVALRERVAIQTDESVRKDEAWVTITLRDGRVLEKHVEHCTGSRESPMSQEALEAKFRSLAEPVLRAGGADRVVSLVGRLEQLEDVGELARSAVRS